MKFKAEKISWIFLSVLAFVLGIIAAFPFIWMVICSFHKESSDLFFNPPKWPETFSFKNYAQAIQRINMMVMFKNTMILVISILFLCVSSSVLIAYGFARFRFRFKNQMFIALLSTMMLPFVVTMVPSYVIYRELNLIGTFLPLILPSIGGSAFFVFILRQFFMGIPRTLDEAARIDGCNSFQTLIYILLPQCKSILVTVSVFSFTGTWSDYIGPKFYLQKEELRTLSIGLEYFLTTSSAVPWHLIMAACVMFSLPLILIFFLAQNVYTKSVITSGLKE